MQTGAVMDSEARVGDKFGEIDIGGKRWRWTAIGRMEERGHGARVERSLRWSVSFRDPEDAHRRFSCELPDQHMTSLHDDRLRRLFDEARSRVVADSRPEGGRRAGLL